MSDKNQEAIRLIQQAIGEQAPEGACVVFALVATRGVGTVSWLADQVLRTGYSTEFCKASLPRVLEDLSRKDIFTLERCGDENAVFWGEKGRALSGKLGPEIFLPAFWQALGVNRKP